MRNGFPFIMGLIAAAVVMHLAPAAYAQTATHILTQYYDAARTQPRICYQVQLRGVRPDTVPHGAFRRYWPGGSLAEHGRLTDGQPDSVWTRYYPAAPGQLPAVARRLPMHGGQPDGSFVVFHPDGRVAQRGSFRQGQLVDSLVTMARDGQPRLLASFEPTAGGGLQGTFQQWRSQFTAQLSGDYLLENAQISFYNAYPRYDMERYWAGQLAAGHFVGRLTEYDADDQPRARLHYSARGQLYRSSLYYPAVWLRHELRDNGIIDPAKDTLLSSQLFWEWQAVGRRQLLLRTWSIQSSIPNTRVFELVPAGRGRYSMNADVTGVSYSATSNRLLAFPPAINARAAQLANTIQPIECQDARIAYQAQLRPGSQLRAQRHPGRWRLGEADTTATVHRPAHRRETRLPDGQRLLETRHGLRLYSATGQLAYRERRRLGVRSWWYYPNSQRQRIDTEGLLGTRVRQWNEQGQLTATEYTSPLGEHPGQKLKRQLKRLHPLRQMRQQLRRFHPLRPLYRKVGKLFHSKKQPRRDSPGT